MLPGVLATWLGFFAAHVSLVAAAAAAAAPRENETALLGCGAPKPSEELVNKHKELADNKGGNNQTIDANTSINVDMYVHVVTSTPEAQSIFPNKSVDMQMQVLNETYAPLKIQFHLQGDYIRVDNASWADKNNLTLAFEKNGLLRKGKQKVLNVFFQETLEPGTAGVTRFPDTWAREGLGQDIVLIGPYQLPETEENKIGVHRKMGITLIHEVGHWFGLLHPFQGGCDGGDYIADTPAMKVTGSHCTPSDSCPGDKYPGMDPVNNFMAYSPDRCLTEFTPDQTRRMHQMWQVFRLFKNTKEIAWKDQCENVFKTLFLECPRNVNATDQPEEKQEKESNCKRTLILALHHACGPLAPVTYEDCSALFAPHKEQCSSKECQTTLERTYKQMCSKLTRSRGGGHDEDGIFRPSETNKGWMETCRDVSRLVLQNCSTPECKADFTQGNMFKGCGVHPRDKKQCNEVLDPLSKHCQTDECREGIQAAKYSACYHLQEDHTQQANETKPPGNDKPLPPLPRHEWRSRCALVTRPVYSECQGSKVCLDELRVLGLQTPCNGDRPLYELPCLSGLYYNAVVYCKAKECIEKAKSAMMRACS